MDTHILGVLRQLHREISEVADMLKSLSEDVKEIRETGVAINFHVNDDDSEDSGEGEEDSDSGETTNTWP